MFRESGRATVRKLQYVQGKGIGKSKRRQTKVKGKVRNAYNLLDSGIYRNSKERLLPMVVNAKKAKRNSIVIRYQL